MRSRQIVISLVTIAVILFLLLREVEKWTRFDWPLFWAQSRSLRLLPALAAAALIYLGFGLRALRWRMLLQPRRSTGFLRLLRPTLIGFSAMALLGRPAEFIRPYLIARQEGLRMSSQLAIWVVERIFDVGVFGVLLTVSLFTSAELRELPYVAQFRRVGLVLVGAVALMGVIALLVGGHGGRLGDVLQRWLSPFYPRSGKRVASTTLALQDALRPLAGVRSFGSVAAVSLLMWVVVALAYLLVVQSFAPPLRTMSFPSVLLLMGFSMLGSLAQLPGGGASQLMVIAGLLNVFSAPAELAVGCGILLWLTTYMAPVPIGLALLRREDFSLTRLTEKSRKAEGEEGSDPEPS